VNDLPCDQPCPPPSASTNPLRSVLLRWVNETTIPPKTVICTPSKSTEAWVLYALFPQDIAVTTGVECWQNPENRFAQQPIKTRIKKTRLDYKSKALEFTAAWPQLTQALEEPRRFQQEFLACIMP
jgi:hypothetical protein